jgi:hypothetical protein
MSARHIVSGGLILFALLAALAVGTRVPFQAHGPDAAMLRLAWRALGEASLECRKPSAEELARLPIHMRRPEICERRLPTFRLVVELDGARVLEESVAPAGAAGDRPAVVLRELPIAPGAHELLVTFAPESGAAAAKRLSERIRVEAGEVALIAEDPQTRELAWRTSRSPRPVR